MDETEPNMEEEIENSKAINHKIIDLQILQIFGFDGKLILNIKLRKKTKKNIRRKNTAESSPRSRAYNFCHW